MIQKAVILCGGLNTRFMPVTKSVPKEMLPVGNKPITQVLIEQLASAGIKQVLLILSKDKMMLYKHFKHDKALENKLTSRGKTKELQQLNDLYDLMQVDYVIQKKPLGTAHAVSIARKWVNGEPFLLLNGDEILLDNKCSAQQLIDCYNTTHASVIGVKKVTLDQVHRYGMVHPEGKAGNCFKIDGIVEKPAPENAPSLYANIGCYLLTPEIFDYIDLSYAPRGEAYITDSIDALTKDLPCYAQVIKGNRYDLGDPENYAINNFDYCYRTAKDNSKFREYIKRMAREIK